MKKGEGGEVWKVWQAQGGLFCCREQFPRSPRVSSLGRLPRQLPPGWGLWGRALGCDFFSSRAAEISDGALWTPLLHLAQSKGQSVPGNPVCTLTKTCMGSKSPPPPQPLRDSAPAQKEGLTYSVILSPAPSHSRPRKSQNSPGNLSALKSGEDK